MDEERSPTRPVELTRAEILHLARLVRTRRNTLQRELAKSTFVPEEGKAHATEIYLARENTLLEHLCTAGGITVDDLDDGGVPRRRTEL